MSKYKVAYIDEEESDIREFQLYAKDDFEVIPIKPVPELYDLLKEIEDSSVDAVIVDFDLTDKDPTIHYKGNDVVEAIRSVRSNYPVFILTSFDGDAIEGSEDVNIIYIKDLMSEKEFEEKVKFKERVIKQIAHYKKNIADKEKRLLQLKTLRDKKELTPEQERELIELDSFIEKSLNKINSIPKEIKSETYDAKLSGLLEKTDEILKKLQ